MKTIIQNVINLFRHFSAVTYLNIAGLSVAFIAFIILMMQVSYDWGYDRFHTNSSRIYRAEIYNTEMAQAVFPRPLIESFIASSPHIVGGAITLPWETSKNIAVEINGERIGYREPYLLVSSDFPEVLGLEMIEGDKKALHAPDKVLIPQSMAKKFFGKESAVGKRLDGDELKAEIAGVYRDFPENSIIENAIYHKLPDNEQTGIWDYHNFQAYILLDDAKNRDLVLENFESNCRPKEYTLDANKIRLTNLHDVYYQTDVIFDSQTVKGSRTQVMVLFFIALLIVGMAAINFTNFSNALVPVRLKSINTQKVLGCSIKTLRLSMLVESVFICLLSLVLALLIVFFLADSSFSETVSGGISFKNHPILLGGTILFSVLVGIIAGVWPSFYITSFSPALVLKGNFGLSPKGKNFRNILVGLQFVASFVLIVGALFVNIQNRFMTHSSLGFNKEQVAVITLNKKLRENTDLVKEQLRTLTGIEEVATVDRIIGGGDTYATYGRSYEGKDVLYRLIHADPSILRVLGISVTDGRDFIPEDALGDGCLIFNETGRKQFELELGKTLNAEWGESRIREKIVGFMDDLKYNSYRNEVEPFAFYTRKAFRQYAMIRVSAGIHYTDLIQSVGATLKKIDPDYPLELSLYNEVLDNLYKKELIMGKQISFFGFVAVFISLIGVFGLVLFESQYRRKEIGIRRVFGSTVKEILMSLNNQYIRVLVICFILATPLAWYAVNRWLTNFADKIPMYWWVFALSFIAVSFITLTTVSLQNWRTAIANPVDSLRAE